MTSDFPKQRRVQNSSSFLQEGLRNEGEELKDGTRACHDSNQHGAKGRTTPHPCSCGWRVAHFYLRSVLSLWIATQDVSGQLRMGLYGLLRPVQGCGREARCGAQRRAPYP